MTRPGQPKDAEMEARIEAMGRRMRPNLDRTLTSRTDSALANGNGQKSANGEDLEWWQARSKKRCRGCQQDFMPRARADRYCEKCKAARASEEAPGNRGGSPLGREPLDETTGPFGRVPASPRVASSLPEHLVLTVETDRVGYFHPVTPKSCSCGATGEWPGSRCPDCKTGVVRLQSERARRGRAA